MKTQAAQACEDRREPDDPFNDQCPVDDVSRKYHSCLQREMALLRSVNLLRCEQWHPGGVDDWSVSEWAVAMLGELGELEEAAAACYPTAAAADLEALGAELADVLIYLDLLAARLRLPPLGGAEGLSGSLINMEKFMCQRMLGAGLRLGDTIKKLNRDRDGIGGNVATACSLQGKVSKEITFLADSLLTFGRQFDLDLWEVVVAKFNEVSRRNDLDVFIRPNGGWVRT
ncbi:hypothetical protein [Maricaulis maris]|uniref:hypothetical protein n=1 Tax=Maricaulis maris TaxID=74318 RepID=UPI003B8E3B29